MGGGIGSILYRITNPLLTNNVLEYFTYNAVGHTMALTDITSAATKTDYYEAFGKTVSSSGSSSNNRLANTKERHSILGLDNHNFRYFDPEIGRYVTRDPIGYGDGMNNYTYVHNNPINFIDPLGLSEQPGITMYETDENQLGHFITTTHGGGRIEGKNDRGYMGVSPMRVHPAVSGSAMIAGSFVPGAGEVMDAYTLADPNAAWWEKGLSGISLGANALTAGFLPNFGGIVRGGENLIGAATHGDDVPVPRGDIPEPTKAGQGGGSPAGSDIPSPSDPKAFAMGTDDHLDEFAKQHNATTWKQFDDPVNWKPQILDKLADPNQKVLFNLDDVDVWGGVQRAASGRGGATDWELLQIKQNPDYWSRGLEFWKEGKKAPNPFE